jgi:hypothetical protein
MQAASALDPEKHAVLSWTRAGLQQGAPVLSLAQVQEAQSLPRLAAVGPAQSGSQLVFHSGPV